MQLIFTKVCCVILLKITNFDQSPLDNFIEVCSAGSCSGFCSDGLAKCWMLPSYLEQEQGTARASEKSRACCRYSGRNVLQSGRGLLKSAFIPNPSGISCLS